MTDTTRELLQRWLDFSLEELPAKGWYPEHVPDIATTSGETLRALVKETKEALAKDSKN